MHTTLVLTHACSQYYAVSYTIIFLCSRAEQSLVYLMGHNQILQISDVIRECYLLFVGQNRAQSVTH